MTKKYYFKKVTKKLLRNTKQKFYGGGKELQVGDKIIFGFTTMYANLYGTPPSSVITSPPLFLASFVLPKNETMLYQLYKF